ncbi:MAG: GAF domain-containing sensor histidine kinase, partial [Chloroflexi bacterium]|nr:GAF domain-containing sensor histidine kinase [Chloroflexota bacterium]
LPRALFISPYPVDAGVETVAVGFVGYFVIWMIEIQEREKRLRQEAVSRLRQLNQVAEEITSELELDRILPKVLQIAEGMVGADSGVVALFDQERNLIGYPYLHNLPQELANVTVPVEKGISGEVVTTGLPAVIEDYRNYSRAIPEFVEAGVVSVVAVPIVSGDQSFGTLTLFSLNKAKSFSNKDVALLTGIGRQAGIAIKNAHLYENMRFYARQITLVQEGERNRIARELHDETIQMLVVISRRLEVLASLPEPLPETATQHLKSLQELIGNTLRGVRRFVQDLRPPTLDHLGLVATLEGLTRDLTEKEGIETELEVIGQVQRLAPDEELALFRIVQETSSNIRRHSRASRASVQVEFSPDKVRVIVTDNGTGFNAPERISDLVSTGRLGLIGMHERARLLGGTLQIQSELDEGTTVIVDVPVHPEQGDAGREVAER